MCIMQWNVWNYWALNMFLGSYMSFMNTTGTEKHKIWHEQLTTTAQAWGRKEQKAGNKNRVNAITVTLWSARALITLPSANSERLMLAPSRKRAPRFLVTFARSDPARSTRHILATFTSAEILAVRSLCLTNTCNNNAHMYIIWKSMNCFYCWLLLLYIALFSTFQQTHCVLHGFCVLAGLFQHFFDTPNSAMDYKLFNMHNKIFLHLYTHGRPQFSLTWRTFLESVQNLTPVKSWGWVQSQACNGHQSMFICA